MGRRTVTLHFYRIHEGSVLVAVGMDYGVLGFLVDTYPVGWMVVTVMRGHKHTKILGGPAGVTNLSSRDHYHVRAFFDLAHSTGYFSVVDGLHISIYTISRSLVFNLV